MSVLLKEAETGTTVSGDVELTEIDLFLKCASVRVWGNIYHGHVRQAKEIFPNHVRGR